MKKINRLTLFLILTFGINFSMVGVFYLLGGAYKSFPGTILATVYMFIPMLAAIIVDKLIHKDKIKKTLLISFKINKWFIVEWLIGPILSFLTIGVSLLIPDVYYSPDMTGMIERFENAMTTEQ